MRYWLLACCLLVCTRLVWARGFASDAHKTALMAVSADGRLLVTASDALRLWALPTRADLKGKPNPDRLKPQAPLAEQRLNPSVTALAFDPAGGRLAVGLADGTVELWALAAAPASPGSVSQPTPIELTRAARWSTRQGSIGSVAFAGQGRVLVAGERDRAVLWDSSGEKLWQTNGLCAAACVSRGLAAVADEQQVHLLDLKSAQVFDFALTTRPYRLQFSDDGRVLAAGSEQGAMVWDVSPQNKLTMRCAVDNRHAMLALSPDGKDFIMDGRLFHSDDGLPFYTLSEVHGRAITCAAYVPTQRLLVTAAASMGDGPGRIEHHLQLWDARSGALWMEF